MKNLKTNETITLCGVCCRDFKTGSTQKIRRTQKTVCETCDFCQFRMGHEYRYIDSKGGAK